MAVLQKKSNKVTYGFSSLQQFRNDRIRKFVSHCPYAWQKQELIFVRACISLNTGCCCHCWNGRYVWGLQNMNDGIVWGADGTFPLSFSVSAEKTDAQRILICRYRKYQRSLYQQQRKSDCGVRQWTECCSCCPTERFRLPLHYRCFLFLSSVR